MNIAYRAVYLALSSTPVVTAVGFSTGLAIRSRGVDVDWGSVGEWVGGLATFAAVVVALWVAITDSQRREEERRDQQAAQARLILVETEADMFGGVAYVRVKNSSTAPVFSVNVDAVHVTPDPLRVRFTSEREWTRLEAGESVTAPMLVFRMDGTTSADLRDPNRMAADVSFVDSAGLRWRRWGNTPPRPGATIESKEPPLPVEEVTAPSEEQPLRQTRGRDPEVL